MYEIWMFSQGEGWELLEELSNKDEALYLLSEYKLAYRGMGIKIVLNFKGEVAA